MFKIFTIINLLQEIILLNANEKYFDIINIKVSIAN